MAANGSKLDEAARAGWLYYVAGNTQDQIASKLGVSRQSAQRLVSLAVAEGRMVFPFMDMSQPGGDPFASLTSREQELLAALAHGRTNAQIAGDLEISLNTVKFHLKNLYGKLSVRNRAQAVAHYLKSHV